MNEKSTCWECIRNPRALRNGVSSRLAKQFFETTDILPLSHTLLLVNNTDQAKVNLIMLRVFQTCIKPSLWLWE